MNYQYRVMQLWDYQPLISSVRKVSVAIRNTTGVSIQDLEGYRLKGRKNDLRHIFFYLVKKYNPEITLYQLGEMFDKDHSTVTYAIGIVKNRMSYDKKYSSLCMEIEKEFLKLKDL